MVPISVADLRHAVCRILPEHKLDGSKHPRQSRRDEEHLGYGLASGTLSPSTGKGRGSGSPYAVPTDSSASAELSHTFSRSVYRASASRMKTPMIGVPI